MSEVQETGTRRKIEHIEKSQPSSSKTRKLYVLGVAFVAVLLLGTSFGMMLSATTPSIPTVIEPGSMVSTVSYVVFGDGSNYYARNGTTGAIDSFSADSATVINWALLHGTRILVKTGVYHLTTSIKVGDNNILEGEGLGTYFMLNANANSYVITNRGIAAGNTGITIKNLRVYGNPNNQSDINKGSGIFLYAVNRTLIEDVTVMGPVNDQSSDLGIALFQYSSNSTVRNCYVYRTTDVGIEASESNGILFEGNRVDYPYDAGLQFIGANGGKASYSNMMIGNFVIHSKTGIGQGAGIEVTASYSDSFDILISGNTIYDGGIGISVNDQSGGQIPKNVIIVNNVIKNMSSLGIQLYGVSNVSVIGNLLDNCVRGIEIKYGEFNHIASTGVVIKDNRIKNTTNYGLVMYNGIDGLVIDGNSFYYTGGPAIAADGSKIQNAQITNNYIFAPDQLVTNNSQEAISLPYLYNSQITGNMIRIGGPTLVYNNAVNLGASSSYVRIMDNDFEKGGSHVVYLAALTGMVLKNNKGFLTENSGTAIITNSTTTTFNHGLGTVGLGLASDLTVTLVLCSFNSSATGGYTWSASATQISVNIVTSGTYTVYWYAQVGA